MWLEHVGRIMEGIRHTSTSRGYSILLGSASENTATERASAERLLEHRADGLIRFSSVADRGEIPSWMAQAVGSGIPGVVVDDVALEGQVDCVVSDDVAGAGLAVEYLARKGHRRIAHFRGDLGRTSADERCKGYLDAVRGLGLGYERVVGDCYTGEGLPRHFEALFAEVEPPTAVFCCVDVVAFQAHEWLRNHVRQPVEVVGYSASSTAKALGIASVVQPFEAMGSRSVDLLLDRLANPTHPYRVERLATRLWIP